MTMIENVDTRMRRTRKLLQAALFELLKEKPLAKIQIKEIAEVAELSRPTFYKQFDTKEELLFSHVDDVLEKISREILLEAQKGSQIDMVTMVTASFRHWQKHKQLLRWVFQVENKNLVIKAFQSQIMAIKTFFDQFVPPLELVEEYEEYVMSFISGGMFMLLKTWLDNDMRKSPEEMASLTFMLLYNGFSPLRSRHVQNPDVLDNAIKILAGSTR